MIATRTTSTRSRLVRALASGLLLASMAAGCSSSGSDRSAGSSGSHGSAGSDRSGDDAVHVSVADPAHCSVYSERTCLAPFPNDEFTITDRTTETGRRIHISEAVTPKNAKGNRVDTTAWNRNDGFSPSQPIVVFLANLDPEASGMAPVTDIGASLHRNAPIVVIDAETGERHPYWSELDAGAQERGERQPALFIRPAVNWQDGHRYLVALRDLKDASGKALPGNPVFDAFRDGRATDDPEVEAKRRHAQDVLALLEKRGIETGDLDLAWDFTVASTESLTDSMLHIRDDALAALGPNEAPAFEVVPTPKDRTADHGAAVVEGTYDVPLYLTDDGRSGSTFARKDADGPPVRRGTYTAKFTCVLPYPLVSPASGRTAPPGGGAQAVVYGHGLLGDRGEVLGFGGYAIDHHSVVCATDWIGLAEDDVGQAVKVLEDLSNLPALADRSQQGFLNFLYLARLMKSPDGLVTDPSFQVDGKPMIATGDVAFWGRSQGGIYGGAATAVSTEWTRAVLGEPGIAYSTLLDRSVDFDEYAVIQRTSYPDKTDWPILVSLMQMIWDRGEPSGYANHMTDGSLPGTPKHTVMLFEAFGDHQVTNVATEVEARTIGARLKEPALARGRSRDEEPFWGIEPLGTLPTDGSVLYVWDFGTPAPPAASLPNRAGDDPHDMDADTPEAMDVVAAFLARDGQIIDACDRGPCNARPRGG